MCHQMFQKDAEEFVWTFKFMSMKSNFVLSAQQLLRKKNEA